MRSLPKVAFITVAREFFDVQQAGNTAQDSIRVLSSLPIELCALPHLIFNEALASSANAALREFDPDIVVVQYGTFALFSHLARAIDGLSAPLVLWVVPEPESSTHRLRLNSLCGANLGANYLYLSGKWFGTVLGRPGDGGVLKEIEAMSRAASAKRQLRGKRLGVVGDAPSGFYPWDIEPQRLAEAVGVELVRIGIDRLFSLARSIDEDAVAREAATLSSWISGLESVRADEVRRSVTLSLAIERMSRELELDALAVRCWPECMIEYKAAPCLALSNLGSRGVPCACEADVMGAVSMLLLKLLSDGTPALMDLVDVRDGDKLVFWHCGSAPANLARRSHVRAATHPNRGVGLCLDCEILVEEATCMRLGVDPAGRIRMASLAGRGTTSTHYLGASLAISVEDAAALVKRLLSLGYEHHYAVVDEDVRGELSAFADMVGMTHDDLISPDPRPCLRPSRR